MPSSESRRILIVAAEASSCLYARRLLEHWRVRGHDVEAFGIGDESMEALGFERLGRAEDLAVVGLTEVLAHWTPIKKAFDDVLSAAALRRPAVALLLDYPGFNLRLAKRLKKLGIPVAYYISPQVWAWRQGRVNLIRQIVDKMLVVFPFEVDFYKSHGVEVEFVGHPLLDELKPEFFDAGARARRRARYGIRDDELTLALMPGSRRSEIHHHLKTQLAVARDLMSRFPSLKPLLFVAPGFTLDQVRGWLGDLDIPLILIKDEPFAMIDLADVVLCASGTATLMVGLLEKPMVIMYRMNPMTALLAKYFVRSTKHFGLINLVLDARAVPEVFQEEANPKNLVHLLGEMVSSKASRDAIRDRLRSAKDRLGKTGATARVAGILERYWIGRSSGGQA